MRAYNFLESLSKKHDIHLLSFISDERERANIEPLKSFCQDVQVVTQSKLQSILSIAANVWRSLPLQALYYRSGSMRMLVDNKVSGLPFDLIYVHLFRMAHYVEHVHHIFRIVDLTDVISREIKRSLTYRGIASRLLYTFERSRIQRYECYIASKFEEIWLISEADKQELVNTCPKANIQIVTNGIDTHRFFPTGETPQPNSIIFTGHFGVAHNIDAAQVLAYQVLPNVQEVIPESTLSLVGAEPSTEVLKLNKLPGVQVTGFVPDLNPYLNRATVFAAPLRFAAGIQNKVLEAMATARPVVTTSMVNEGIRARAGEELIVADTPQKLAQEVINLFQNPATAQALGKSALSFVTSKYSWDIVMERINQIEQSRIPKT